MPRHCYIFWFCDFDSLECLMFPSFFLFPITAQSPMDVPHPGQAKLCPSPPDVMPPWDSPVCSNKHSHYFFLISQLPTLIYQGFRAPLKISSLGGTSTLASEFVFSINPPIYLLLFSEFSLLDLGVSLIRGNLKFVVS